MLPRLLSVLFLAVIVSGCASTQTKTQNEQMQNRMTDLEKSLQAKDAEITDLQYQVKDLSSKVDVSKPGSDQAPAVTADAVDTKSSIPVSGGQIIRVKVSAEKIQRALKAAGVYTGPIDGKVGAGTKEAVVEFQKSHGLKADGVLGKKTWDELKTYLK